jgi:hypothetical protein
MISLKSLKLGSENLYELDVKCSNSILTGCSHRHSVQILLAGMSGCSSYWSFFLTQQHVPPKHSSTTPSSSSSTPLCGWKRLFLFPDILQLWLVLVQLPHGTGRLYHLIDGGAS